MFYTEYLPIMVEEPLGLLRRTGLRTVEIPSYSYMQGSAA